ncbi:FAD-dependent oxidoreductase [Dorea sp. ICN-14282]|uniref:FAD-dependent oxidoreductase n=1 Tax=Dorea sp. ICN-14282 TaxID=3134654 RepID=UPI0030C0FC05
MKFNAMFSPIQIGPMTVKNRFVVPPMGNNFANTDGTWSEQSAAYYGERAKGQFGLITIEASVVHQGAKGGPRKPCLYNDDSIESLKRITDACHKEGAKVSVQLQNAGPEGNAKNAGAPIEAATAIQSSDGRDIPVEVPTEKVYELVKGYGEAAVRAMKGGVDAVEIHMAHGYLVNSFLSPRTNKRVDEFGGSFENRMRFSRLIIEEVKARTEGKIAVLARINSTEDMFGGLDNHDMCAIAEYLEECGVDGLHVSRAVHLKDEYMWAPTGIHGGFSAELVENIKKCVSIPVITVGRYTEPQFAEIMVKKGRADLVAFGRQSLADPHMPLKAMEERLEDMTPCIACLQGCVANMYAGQPICCLTNPVLGRESEGLPLAEKKKKVYVIGGGVAGMCAAFTAKRRGHDVTLFEATDRLGGNMRLAAYPPGKGDITNMIRSYIVKCEKAGVDIKMNTKVTAEMLKSDTPDAVILATGSETLILPFIKGIQNPDIVHGVDCLDGSRSVGHKVLVVGGGMVGAETAEFLAEQGHDVSVIEMRHEIGPDVIHEHRIFLMEGLEKYGVQKITDAAVSEIFSDGVSYKNAADKSDETLYEVRGFDTVVLSMGFSSRYTHREGQEVVYDFADELRAIVPEVHVVGDAVRARRALDATKEAYDVALKL